MSSYIKQNTILSEAFSKNLKMDSGEGKYIQEVFNIIRGLPLSAVFNKELIEEVMDYVPHDGDVIISSYPKTGTTWLQYIIHQIITKAEVLPDLNALSEKSIPCMEMVGIAALDAVATKPRVYRHHLPYNLIKKNPNTKIIYIYRNPEDTFISYYHYISNVLGALDFEQYFDGFITGHISHGRYFDHVLSFLKYKESQNLLFVSYEQLKLNTKEEILRIAKFLGQEYFEAIVSDASVLGRILEHASFDYMKKNLCFKMPEDPMKHGFSKDVPQKEINFFRKGVIGDGKKSLSEDKLKKLREVAEDVLKGTSVLEEWYGN